jgi:hypothetical protein
MRKTTPVPPPPPITPSRRAAQLKHGDWDLLLSRRLSMMKFSRAISRVKWLSGEQTNVWKTISFLVLRVLVWLEFEPADSPRELHHTRWLYLSFTYLQTHYDDNDKNRFSSKHVTSGLCLTQSTEPLSAATDSCVLAVLCTVAFVWRVISVVRTVTQVWNS